MEVTHTFEQVYVLYARVMRKYTQSLALCCLLCSLFILFPYQSLTLLIKNRHQRGRTFMIATYLLQISFFFNGLITPAILTKNILIQIWSAVLVQA